MDFQVIKVKEDVLQENNQRAEQLRTLLKSKGIFFINVMASPGSGKTTLLTNLINKLKDKFNIGVMEADIDGDVDAERISKNTGVRAIQIHTSGACHLTAQMVNDAINEFNIYGLNLLKTKYLGIFYQGANYFSHYFLEEEAFYEVVIQVTDRGYVIESIIVRRKDDFFFEEDILND